MFVATLLTHLAPGLITGMAQRWCAIPKSDASVDVVGGHDVVDKGEVVTDVFVLWLQLLEWEK